MRAVCFVVLATLGLFGCGDLKKVGPQPDGGHLVATGQLLHPAGIQTEFDGRPLDLALSADGTELYVRDNRGLVVVDVSTGKLLEEAPIPGGSSYTGLTLAADGSLWTSAANSNVCRLKRGSDGKWAVQKTLTMPKPKVGGEAYPCGLAITPDSKTAYVCLSRNNTLGVVDLDSGKVEEVSTDICPYAVKLSADGKTAYVSCWGGEPPRVGRRHAPSSETEVEVDERGVSTGGTLAIIDLEAKSRVARVKLGLQPSDMALTKDGKTLYVANANSDTVSVVDLDRRSVARTIVTQPQPGQLFGSAPSAVALSPDESILYVALGGNNAVLMVGLHRSDAVIGLIPAGWYPADVLLAGPKLFVANAKGVGSRGAPRADGGRSVYSFRGSVSLIDVPDSSTLAAWTARALSDALVREGLRALEKGSPTAKATAVPAKLGEPSTIEHVVYILKENRTYDQVFGDLPQGDGDPKLCTFPREVTPNHHALAEQFVLLDNYYCNGVNSADGHAWAMEGNASAHLERSFGGWTRSYPFGDDPLSYSSSGFLWDNVLAHGLTFRNYGEFDYATPVPDVSFKEIYEDFKAKTGKIKFQQKIGVERARIYANPKYPGWNMKIPDVLRAQVFVDELKEFEAKGTFPNLTIIYLPQDHGAGATPAMPNAAAYMADNDLALGRVIEALTKSKFWRKMAIFVNEDDPQNGFDHVDGHRSLCLVISPYAKRNAVISEFFNQTSVLHTMQRMLGIPPMNQMDAMAPLMAPCFSDRPDFAPFKCLPPGRALDELVPPPSELKGEQRYWAEQSAKLDFSRPDAGNDALRNRILWSQTMGNQPYPSEWEGAHGKGLKSRRLVSSRVESDD